MFGIYLLDVSYLHGAKGVDEGIVTRGSAQGEDLCYDVACRNKYLRMYNIENKEKIFSQL